MILLVREYARKYFRKYFRTSGSTVRKYFKVRKYFRTEVLPYLLAKFMLATFEGTKVLSKYESTFVASYHSSILYSASVTVACTTVRVRNSRIVLRARVHYYELS